MSSMDTVLCRVVAAVVSSFDGGCICGCSAAGAVDGAEGAGGSVGRYLAGPRALRSGEASLRCAMTASVGHCVCWQPARFFLCLFCLPVRGDLVELEVNVG